jgi:dynein heavy chain
VVKVRIPKELLKGTTLPPGSGHQLSKNTTVLSDPPTNLSSATSGKSLSPSERIGVLYTPTSNVRTLARNDQMHVYEYQVSYRDTEPPPPPPMPMKDADRGIQGKDPTTSHFLPLDDFDNLEYDRHSPEEWVSLGGEGGAKARSKYYTDKGDEVWAPCHVSSYDVTEELFTINWNHNQATKQVRRLNIIFDEEDEDEWKIRVEEASVLRREAEAQMRLHLYVQSLDEAGNCPINEDQIDRIMYLVAQDFPLDHLHTVETCIGEVRQLYSFALRKAVHDYKMRNPEEMKRLIELHLPVADQAMPDSLDTLLATVDTPSPNFNAAKKAIQQNLFQSHALLNATLHSIHARWRQFESDYFCDTTMKSVSLPCELHIFSDIQSRKGSNVAERLKDDWAASLNTTIQNDLDTHFNFYEEDVERYNSSRMYRFFRMVNTMMSSQLRGLLVDTIQDYTTFMLTYSVQLPDEYSRDSDRYDELPADISERTHWQARREEVLAFHLKLRDDATVKLDVSKKKSKGRREEEVPEQGDVIQEEEEFEPLLFPYEVAPGDFYERIVKMTQVPNGLRPLFVIKLISNGDAVTFYPLLEELEDKVKGVFDSFFSNSEGVRGVGDQLFPLLSLKPFNLHPLDTQDPVVLSAKDRISEVLSTNMEGPRQLQGMYRSFEYILKGDEQLIDLFAKRNPPPTLMDFDVALERLERDCARIANRTMNEVKFELIKVECESVKKALLSKAKELMNAVMRQLESRLSKETRRVSSTYEDIFNRIGFEPTKPEELQELKEYIDQVPADLDRLTTTFQFCTDATNLLSRYRYTIDTDDFEAYWTAFEWPKKVHQQLEDSDFRCKEYRNAFQQELRENCEHLTEEINHLAAQVESLSLDSDERLADKYYEKVMSLEAKIRKHEDEIQLYNSRETLFGLPTTQWAHIKDIKNQFLPFRDLWDTVHKFGSFSEGWMTTGLESLDPRLIDQYVQQWTQKVSSISKKIKDEGPLEVVRHLRDNLDRFRPNIPLIGALRSNLQPSHWKQIYQLVGADGKNVSTENKNLQEYLKMGMLRHINEIEEIAEVARKTFALESDLYQMETDWKKIVFEMEPFGQTYRLRASEATQQTLDEHIMKTQSLLGKPIIRQGMAPSVAAKAANWAKTLDNIQLTLDEWYKCQNTWAYLEPIFSSADISKNMPVEAAKFANINSSWIRIMETTRNNPVVTSRCMDESLPKDLTDHNQTLEEILRKLHAFLETKRMAFPRFYFISNEELLQILSDSKDPYLVQPYLAKCFEGIKTIQFQDNMDITAMESAEGEVVAFSKKVNPADHNNSVELWLQNVETVMMDSIREQLRRAREDYKTRKRTEFIRHWPGQVVLAICSHFWTMEASEAMEADGSRGLYTYYDKCNAQLDEMIVLVRDRGLKSVERKTLEALVVIEVHSRDIVGELAEKGIDSIAAFDWLAQLRYYWTADGHMDVCQINATLRYGYEYLGNSGRLVITQLTDRCYRTLMGALHLNYGGAPEGPAGTGKTETTKDLAKALGKYCVVYNCSDQITAKDMAKLFKGLSQSGSWGCFDEFNRIEIQVLSVIAQQVATIQEAITQKKVEFIFEGAQIKLKMGTAVFITMNPGYAGRAELPDNLKALFRPVAMMVPNYAMIGQIQLFSYGFLHGKLLSEKIVATYRLCSEQLSSQDHYDYGMRAVKAVLTAAGRLKRQYPDEDESVLMLRSIQDVNLPKFLAQDVELFRGIISDLFPSVKLPDPDYEVMTDALVQVCQETNLQPTPYFLEKCFQTYEMIVVRHGMMIVGYSFGGKTKVLHSLASALGIMETTQHENKALLTTMNPKAITMGQLYGIVDQSGEWNDGVLSKAFRTVAKENSRDRKWLVLDGPLGDACLGMLSDIFKHRMHHPVDKGVE